MFRQITTLLLVIFALDSQITDAQRGFFGDRFPPIFRPPFIRPPFIRPPFIRPPFIRPPQFRDSSLGRVLAVVCSNGSQTTEARAQTANCARCFTDNLTPRRIWGQAQRTPDLVAARRCMSNLPSTELSVCQNLLPADGSTTLRRNDLSHFTTCLRSLHLAERVRQCVNDGNDFDRCLRNGPQAGSNGGAVTRNPVTEQPNPTSPLATTENSIATSPESSSNNPASSNPESTSENPARPNSEPTSENPATSNPEATSGNSVTASPSSEPEVVTAVVG